MTIESAVVQIIGDLPDGHFFSGLWLTERVRELRGGNAMDGSVLKLLREGKHPTKYPALPKLNYEVVDRGKSLYRKLPLYEPKFTIEESGQLAMGI